MVLAVFETLAILFSQSASRGIWGALLGLGLLLTAFLAASCTAPERMDQAAFSRQLIAVQ